MPLKASLDELFWALSLRPLEIPTALKYGRGGGGGECWPFFSSDFSKWFLEAIFLIIKSPSCSYSMIHCQRPTCCSSECSAKYSVDRRKIRRVFFGSDSCWPLADADADAFSTSASARLSEIRRKILKNLIEIFSDGVKNLLARWSTFVLTIRSVTRTYTIKIYKSVITDLYQQAKANVNFI